MNDQKDNQEFEKYLQNDSSLSKRYQLESSEEPPDYLDTAIITAAKKAATAKKAGANSSNVRWYIPVSLAAVVVICFGIVFRIYDESLPRSKQQTAMDSKNTEIMKDSRMRNKLSGEENFSDEARNTEGDKTGKVQIMKKEMASPSASLKIEPGRSKSSIDSLQTLPVEEEAEKILTPESIRGLAELKGQSDMTATSALSSQDWIQLINKLWNKGDKEGAQTELKHFLEAYPDYPKEQLEFQIPREMDMSGIN